MVRWLKYTKAFLRLIRLPNLVIIALTMYILRFFTIVPQLNNHGLNSALTGLQFFILVLVTLFIAAAGYVINDYFDRKSDLINRPGKVVLGRILSRRAGMVWHIVFNTLGIGIGVLFSYSIGMLKFSILFVVISGLLWFYSTTYKRQVLIGNLIVALLVAMVPIILLVYEIPLLFNQYRPQINSNPEIIKSLAGWVIAYGIFAFLLTLIREIVKDVEDFEGDFAFGHQTIPISWGAETARYIVLGITLFTIGLICFILVRKIDGLQLSLLAFFLTVLPLLFFLVIFLRAKTKPAYHQASSVLKVVMIGGLSFLIIAPFLS